jgi:predicted nucleotidyltransferase
MGEWIMQATGVIVEYNPFHNGHLYHLNEAKRKTNADVVIAVMSGNFLQRGEPAIVSKWTRTHMALAAGIDIVIELPYTFAVQKAETFAFGAVFLLESMKCTRFCFGSESGTIDHFVHTVQMFKNHKNQIDAIIKQEMKKGVSYPTAVSRAFQSLNIRDGIDLSQPNNILGFHYVKAVDDIQASIVPYTIERKSAHYHDERFSSDTIASATSIRKAFFETKDWNQIASYVPVTTLAALQNYYQEIGQLHHWESYWPFLQYRLITSSIEQLREIYEVEEGIEYRLKEMAPFSVNFHDFMEKMKTKRYTWTRLQRMCVHILMNTRKEDMWKSMKAPSYIRLLGMSENGRNYLSQIKKDLSLPLISKVGANVQELLAFDLLATRTYGIGVKKTEKRRDLMNMDFTCPPVYFKKS